MSRRSTGPSKEVADLVLSRDRYSCVRCGQAISGERGVGWSLQHRRPRGMGGSQSECINQPANLIVLCGSAVTNCHGAVESSRDASRAYGYLVSQHTPVDPTEVPVLVTVYPGDGVHLPEIEWRLLDDSGSWTVYGREAADA